MAKNKTEIRLNYDTVIRVRENENITPYNQIGCVVCTDPLKALEQLVNLYSRIGEVKAVHLSTLTEPIAAYFRLNCHDRPGIPSLTVPKPDGSSYVLYLKEDRFKTIKKSLLRDLR